MSAFVVNKSHINAMLQAAFRSGRRYGGSGFKWEHDGELQTLNENNADEIGQMLLDENIASVMYRYEDSTITDLPGSATADYLLPFQWHPMGKTPTAIEAIKLCHCYSYQSCEHPGWKQSNAKAFSDTLIDETVGMVDGWDQAPWEWEEELTWVSRPVRLA